MGREERGVFKGRGEKIFQKLTSECTEEEHPSPIQHFLYPTAYGKGQTVANVDTKVVDTDGRPSDLRRKVVSYQRHRKGIAASSPGERGGCQVGVSKKSHTLPTCYTISLVYLNSKHTYTTVDNFNFNV